MRARFPALPALCLALTALTGCGPKPGTQAAGGSAPHVLRIVASDFKFDAPDSISGGVTTVRIVNQGSTFHHLQLVRLDQGKTITDFAEALKQPGPPPAWATMVGGPNAVNPAGDSVTAILDLEPGTYGMLCLIPGANGVPHFAMGMVRPLVVTAPAVADAEPVASDTIRLVDYDFQIASALKAGRQVIRVENDGQQAHELVLVRLADGKTATDFAGWVEKMAGPPPASGSGGITGILPGAHNLMEVDLSPGNYALICFFPDMKDGKPHLAHGMIKSITVS